ncbi:MAG TPA: hypothetical protein ENG66_08420 [Thermococcus sp.]|nr:hypothetical protein [Thermococcus sp.]
MKKTAEVLCKIWDILDELKRTNADLSDKKEKTKKALQRLLEGKDIELTNNQKMVLNKYRHVLEELIEVEAEIMNRLLKYRKLRDEGNSKVFEKLGELSAMMEKLEVLVFTMLRKELEALEFVQIPTDFCSEALNLLPVLKFKPEPKLWKEKEKGTYYRGVQINEVKIVVEDKKISLDNVANFFNEIKPRMGDVYDVLLDKALKDSYRKGKYSAIDITSQEIAEEISEKPTKRTNRQVAEAFADLMKITIRIPVENIPEELKKWLVKLKRLDPKAKEIIIQPFIFLYSQNFEARRLRVHKAIVAVHPLLWALYFDLNMRIPAPRALIRLDPSKTPERWAKILGHQLFNHARRNKNQKQLKIKVKTILERTGVINEINEMIENKHHVRAFQYLQKAFEIIKNDILNISLSTEISNLAELLRASIVYKNPLVNTVEE